MNRYSRFSGHCLPSHRLHMRRRCATYLQTVVWPFDEYFCGNRDIRDILRRPVRRWKRIQRLRLFHWTSGAVGGWGLCVRSDHGGHVAWLGCELWLTPALTTRTFLLIQANRVIFTSYFNLFCGTKEIETVEFPSGNLFSACHCSRAGESISTLKISWIERVSGAAFLLRFWFFYSLSNLFVFK